MNLLLALALIVASWVGSWFWLRSAKRWQVLDVPDARSAHNTPVARGGGVVFISIYLAAVSWFLSGDFEQWPLLGSAVLLVMLVGLADDLYDLSAFSRLLVQLLAAVLIIWTVQPVATAFLTGWSGPLGLVALVFAAVWVINLYNFMDGIDGIAALEALSVCLVMALIYSFGMHQSLLQLSCILACAVLGFLAWNLPSARLFMGDAGSGGLGTAFLGLMALSAAESVQLFLCCWLMLSVFIVDASWTLLMRLFAGKKIWVAHNTHAYQILSRKWASHLKVSLAVTGYNLLWLGPLACAFYYGKLSFWLALVLCWLPLIMVCFTLRAGMQRQVAS